MGLREWAIDRIPLQYQVPMRYWYRFVLRRLEKELPIIMGAIARDRLSIDVGANNGVYTYALSRLSRRVEAFEPQPACARKLVAFRAKNVHVHQVALSSSSGVKEMFVPLLSGVVHTALGSFVQPSGGFEKLTVRAQRLDEYRFDDVSFIKIDVEGHELDVLRGATETLSRCKPVLLIEVEQRHLPFPMEAVFEEALQFGYKGFFVFRQKVLALPNFSYSAHQEPFLHDVLSADYVNNFIFVHPSGLQGDLGW